MQNVFLDIGGNEGQGLRSLMTTHNVDHNWIVETFEPEPRINMAESMKDLPFVKINKCAVSDYNGKILFSQMEEFTQGSSVVGLMDAGVCADVNNISYRKNDSIIEVDCVDISDIVSKYKGHYILMKIDAEGSEFRIIRKLTKDNLLNQINELYIEWHTPYLSTETEESCEVLTQIICDNGVTLHVWH